MELYKDPVNKKRSFDRMMRRYGDRNEVYWITVSQYLWSERIFLFVFNAADRRMDPL